MFGVDWTVLPRLRNGRFSLVANFSEPRTHQRHEEQRQAIEEQEPKISVSATFSAGGRVAHREPQMSTTSDLSP
jgi:hypothetical protein